ncbi:Gfo/Idh/MocA family oxidoreductase [Eubacteriales bacterium OttesenSCG-928-G02]|nr:Gfo/Idh/MocA family oxidoreductase [Eubacteriales bacterium OttesenSCG-928-G02]
MEKILRAGLIGVGSMGRGHLDNYINFMKEKFPIKIVALCDVDEKKFTNYKADFNLGEVGADGYDFTSFNLYKDLDEMLEKEQLDMVTIALPTYMHCWATVKCLKKGIDVICEKPMATSVEECNEMIATAKETGRRLMIGQCLRFQSSYLELKKWVDEETLGKPVAAFFFRGGGTPLWSYENWLLNREKGGGALFDQHVHDVDSTNFIFGMPKKVSTLGKTLFENSAYDTLTTNYVYENGMPVNIQNDWTLSGPHFYQQFRVNFEKGTIFWDAQGFRVYHKDGTTQEIELKAVNPYYEETKYFATTILEDKPADRVPPETSRDTIKIIVAERESADRSGELVDIK